MINGIVVQNGDRKARLRVKTEGAAILRLRDAMRPEEATTPERKAYYVAQMAVAGEITDEDAQPILASALEKLSDSNAGKPAARCLADIAKALDAKRYYAVMRGLGVMIGRGGPLQKKALAATRDDC